LQKNLTIELAKRTCHVGQITCICSSSQELGPPRETGRGLFDSDGDPHERRVHPRCQRIAARRVPGSSSETFTIDAATSPSPRKRDEVNQMSFNTKESYSSRHARTCRHAGWLVHVRTRRDLPRPQRPLCDDPRCGSSLQG
jgi:hypothetical protein